MGATTSIDVEGDEQNADDDDDDDGDKYCQVEVVHSNVEQHQESAATATPECTAHVGATS